MTGAARVHHVQEHEDDAEQAVPDEGVGEIAHRRPADPAKRRDHLERVEMLPGRGSGRGGGIHGADATAEPWSHQGGLRRGRLHGFRCGRLLIADHMQA